MVKDVSKKFSTIEVLKSVVRRRPQGCGDDRWSIGSPGAVTLPFALRKMPSSEAFKAFSVLYVMKDHLVRGGKLSILFRICWKLQCTHSSQCSSQFGLKCWIFCAAILLLPGRIYPSIDCCLQSQFSPIICLTSILFLQILNIIIGAAFRYVCS